MEIPRRLSVRGVRMRLNCTLEGAQEMTVENRGELTVWSHARSAGRALGVLAAANISVRAGGLLELLVGEGAPPMKVYATSVTVNGLGRLHTNQLLLTADNVTIDRSGEA